MNCAYSCDIHRRIETLRVRSNIFEPHATNTAGGINIRSRANKSCGRIDPELNHDINKMERESCEILPTGKGAGAMTARV